LAGFCASANCLAINERGLAIRYNCQRTCDSCRQPEIIALEVALALAQTGTDGSHFSIAVTFDVGFAELSTLARASLQALLKPAFCGRITVVGVVCNVADLVLTLSAGSHRRAHRSNGTTIATVILPSSTTQAQAQAISSDIKENPITVLSGSMVDGALISSVDTTVTFETNGAAGPVSGDATSDRTEKITTAVLAAVLAISVLGVAYVINARRTSYQIEKTIMEQDLGWDHGAEEDRTTVWHQEGSAAGSHYFPQSVSSAEPAPLESEVTMTCDNSFTAPPSQMPAVPARLRPLSSRLQ
jgi:hypothetical protein